MLFLSLVSVDDDELNVLTIEALQIILVHFFIIIERQLSENLPGGKLNEHTEGVDGAVKDRICNCLCYKYCVREGLC